MQRAAREAVDFCHAGTETWYAQVGGRYCAGKKWEYGNGVRGGARVGCPSRKTLGSERENVGRGIKYSYVTIVEGA